MKIKTAELTGAALDWAVAKAEGYRDANDPGEHTDPEEGLDRFNWMFMREPGVAAVYLANLRYPTDWAQGGPIIEREGILFHGEKDGNAYNAWIVEPYASGAGPTHLIAAMRCYVASKLGVEVDVPEELL